MADALQHVNVIAYLSLAFAALGGLFLLLAFLGVGAATDGGVAVGSLMGIVAVFFGILLIPLVVAGVGLLQRRSWARTLTFIVAALMLLNFPVGTAFGIYAFWALTRPGVREAFERPATATPRPT